MMLPPPIDPAQLHLYALWQMYHRRRKHVYIRTPRIAFKRPSRWEPWNDDQIPPIQFIEYFRMSLEDFCWPSDELRGELQLDMMRRGDPLSVEAQVAVGLYWLGHGATDANISHVFNIGKETADKASGRFVMAVLQVLRRRSIGWPALDNINQWQMICDSFGSTHRIPDIVGAIDGTHIPLAVPPHDIWNGYINRKGWESIVFQCVVDGDGNFRNVVDGQTRDKPKGIRNIRT